MPRPRTNRQQNRRLDALIGLPLDRFRAAVAMLPPEEAIALARRMDVRMVEQRWALGSHGIARHRAPRELAMLSRRLAETREVLEPRPQVAPVPLRPIEPAPVVLLRDGEALDRAA